MFRAIPLSIFPLILVNAAGIMFGGEPWGTELFSLTMLSGAVWTMDLADLIVAIAIVLLYFEVIRAARPGSRTILNHVLSTGVLVIYVVEFIAMPAAANSMFFILALIALFDVIAGFTITIRTSTRDIAIDPAALDGPL